MIRISKTRYLKFVTIFNMYRTHFHNLPVSILICFLYLNNCCVNAQIISSEKKSIRINNFDNQDKAAVDQVPPKITFINPVMTEASKYISDKITIDIIGKVSDDNGVFSLFVNSERIQIADDGLFKIRYWLKPGENMISVVAMDNNDNITESSFVIEYPLREEESEDHC
jgi:hypothetical protein